MTTYSAVLRNDTTEMITKVDLSNGRLTSGPRYLSPNTESLPGLFRLQVYISMYVYAGCRRVMKVSRCLFVISDISFVVDRPNIEKAVPK